MTDTRNVLRRLSAARESPGVTCSASRHAQQIAERLMLRVDMADDRTEHAGESIAATVAALWDARTKIARLEAERDAARREAMEECARKADEAADIHWRLWDEEADPIDQGRALAYETLAAAIRAAMQGK